MFEKLIQQIEAHDRYGPAMKEAAEKQDSLVLNYHTHGLDSGYCVSIATRQRGVLPVLGQALPMEELVHVNGIGQTEDQRLPLMEPLCEELVAHYGLTSVPEIWLDGKPVAEPEQEA
jgi:hypothetical protein